jgi:hypothetical protein
MYVHMYMYVYLFTHTHTYFLVVLGIELGAFLMLGKCSNSWPMLMVLSFLRQGLAATFALVGF